METVPEAITTFLEGENSLFYNPVSREKLWNEMLIEENDYNYTIFMKALNNFMDDEISLFTDINCRPTRFFDNDGTDD